MFPFKFSFNEIMAAFEARESFRVTGQTMYEFAEDQQYSIQQVSSLYKYLVTFFPTARVILFEAPN